MLARMKDAKFIIAAIACAATTLGAPDAEARSFRVGQIPNGGDFSCDSCHGRASLLPRDLTPFGLDVNRTLRNSNVDWSAIWNLDSDGDGFSNGLELGDPNGTWRTGMASPDAPTANPGVPNEGICGNGDLEPDELCDLTNLDGESCESLGFGRGTLSCHPLCRWNTSQCGFCGDGYLNPDYEECDIDKFPDGASCADHGFLNGELSCDSNCKIVTTDCTDEAPGVCGDGIISRGEMCDGENMGAIDCVRIAYAGGVLRCTEDCRWDASDCITADGIRVGDLERAEADPGDEPPDPDPQNPDPQNPDVDPGTTGGTTAPGTTDDSGCATAAGTTSVWVLLGALLLRARRRRSSD